VPLRGGAVAENVCRGKLKRQFGFFRRHLVVEGTRRIFGGKVIARMQRAAAGSDCHRPHAAVVHGPPLHRYHLACVERGTLYGCLDASQGRVGILFDTDVTHECR